MNYSQATTQKLNALQLENVTQGLLKHVENDVIARFALETHLYNLNENHGSAAVSYFVKKFIDSLN